jgi:AcrR family transcriptional regulator
MPRSRSTHAHQQALDAALKLFARRGIDATSMDAIAAASGVSKATIYKHWRDKDALCLEALARLHGLDEPPIRKTGDHRADMIAVLSRRAPERQSHLQTRMMPHFMAYAARNPAFGNAWRARVMEPPRIQLVQLIKRARADGSLPAGFHVDIGVAMLIGPMMYGRVLSLLGRPSPENMAERVVAAFWKAFGRATPVPPKKRRKAR